LKKTAPRNRQSIWKRAKRTLSENDRPILSRLIGLETEYAILHRKPSDDAIVQTIAFDFDRFATELELEIPIAKSFRNPHRVFLANGGCVSLEHGMSLEMRDVLIESATPECKSPRDLLTYQIALERIVSNAIHRAFVKNDPQLLKGSADSKGQTYGQHESYEMRIATGKWLLAWRMGLVAMFPLVVTYRFLAGFWFLVIWMMGQATSQAGILKRILLRQPQTPRSHSAKRFWGVHPRWIGLCALGLRCMHAPLAAALWLNMRCFALIPHRRHLASYFASRCIVDGAGYLDSENRYWVSVRAALVNSIIGFGSYRNERPIFRCDSWLRGLCTGPVWTLGNYGQLFRARQRVEIAMGDSGLCQQSQYVRLGATALVLDMVEKSVPHVPSLRNVVHATSRFARDWMLLTTVVDRKNKQWSALDIQHAFTAAVRGFLQTQPNVPVEAWRILDQWQTTLNQLRPTDDESHLPRAMLGRIDWLSKLWILHQMKGETNWQVRKKIDLRYHEISEDGYHRRLHRMLELAPLLEESDIEKATRTPPSGTPATQRGYIVREFAGDECELKIDWEHAEFQVEEFRKKVYF
jgi:Pup amidohydrolase